MTHINLKRVFRHIWTKAGNHKEGFTLGNIKTNLQETHFLNSFRQLCSGEVEMNQQTAIEKARELDCEWVAKNKSGLWLGSDAEPIQSTGLACMWFVTEGKLHTLGHDTSGIDWKESKARVL